MLMQNAASALFIRLFVFRDSDAVGFMAGIVESCTAEPRVEAFEGFVGDAVLEGKGSPVFHGTFDFNGVGSLSGIDMADVEIVCQWIGDDFFEGEDAVDVTFGFFTEKEIVIVLGLLLLHLAGDEGLTAVVGGGCQCPIAKAFVGFAQVGGCCFRGFDEVVAFVYFIGDFEPEFFAGSFHDLPDADGSCRRDNLGFQPALDDSEVFEVVGDAVGFENGFDDSKVAWRFL